MTNERLQELKRKVNGLAGKSDLTYQDEVLIDELIDSAMQPQTDWQQKYRRCEVEREGTQNALDDNRLKLRDCLEELGKVKENYVKATRQYEELLNAQGAMKPVNWTEVQKAYRANGCKPVTLHDGLYEVEIRRKYDNAKPVSEEVQMAIDDMERRKRIDIEAANRCGMEANQIHHLNLAIQALKQMKPTEPCDVCKNAEFIEAVVFSRNEFDELLWNRARSNICPNCGRNIGDKNEG